MPDVNVKTDDIRSTIGQPDQHIDDLAEQMPVTREPDSETTHRRVTVEVARPLRRRQKEGPVEKRLRKQCREHGMGCLKYTSPARAGVPDRLVIAPAATVLVELKKPGGVLEPHQANMHRKIRAWGGEVHVIDTVEKVDVFVNELHKRGLKT